MWQLHDCMCKSWEVSVLQCDDQAYDQNEQMLERLLAVDDVDAVHTNCAGLA